jgi:uncharacterized membrane protein (DUF2068 family)
MSAPTARIAPWEDFILRLIAIYKLCHAVFFMAVGFGLLKLRHVNLVDFISNHLIIPYHLNPEEPFVDWLLEKADKVTPHAITMAVDVTFLYAALFMVEGVGLYMRKRWAEWLVVVVAGLLLPVEFKSLFHHVVWWKIAVVIGNLFIVGYLIHRITLDARLKKAKLQQEEAKASLASGLNGSRPSAGNRVSSNGTAPAKTR